MVLVAFSRQVRYSHAHWSENSVLIYLGKLSPRNLARINVQLVAPVWWRFIRVCKLSPMART